MKANTSWIFNKFWNTSAKEIYGRVKEYSDDELMILFRSISEDACGPQGIQYRFIIKELIKRSK
jgi:hypothetical protein